MTYLHPNKRIRSTGIGLPGDLWQWLKDEARKEGVPVSRVAAKILAAHRDYVERRRRRDKSLLDKVSSMACSALVFLFSTLG